MYGWQNTMWDGRWRGKWSLILWEPLNKSLAIFFNVLCHIGKYLHMQRLISSSIHCSHRFFQLLFMDLNMRVCYELYGIIYTHQNDVRPSCHVGVCVLYYKVHNNTLRKKRKMLLAHFCFSFWVRPFDMWGRHRFFYNWQVIF